MKPEELYSVVFSFDRPCQLEAFLRSMKKMWAESTHVKISILYKYSTEDFKKGYDIVKNRHPEFEYYNEINFANDLKNLFLQNRNKKYAVFFCDDDLWKEQFTLDSEDMNVFENDPLISCFSIRMHPGINKCYTEGNVDTPPPIFVEGHYIWYWTDPKLKGEWKYVSSVDGHIFRMDLAYYYVMYLPYTNVTLLEGYMAGQMPKHLPKMICLEKSPLLNIPLNKVSHSSNNINMNVSKEYLNEKFLNREIIDTDFYMGFNNVSPHQEVELKWTRI